jgi:hypothetical protein
MLYMYNECIPRPSCCHLFDRAGYPLYSSFYLKCRKRRAIWFANAPVPVAKENVDVVKIVVVKARGAMRTLASGPNVEHRALVECLARVRAKAFALVATRDAHVLAARENVLVPVVAARSKRAAGLWTVWLAPKKVLTSTDGHCSNAVSSLKSFLVRDGMKDVSCYDYARREGHTCEFGFIPSRVQTRSDEGG